MSLIRKIIIGVILVPLAVIIIAFAVANRHSVTLSFDPFSPMEPAYTASVPLFVLIFAMVILGVIVGGFAAWLRQGKWRRAARQLDADVRVMRQELAANRQRLAAEQARVSPTPASTTRYPATS